MVRRPTTSRDPDNFAVEIPHVHFMSCGRDADTEATWRPVQGGEDVEANDRGCLAGRSTRRHTVRARPTSRAVVWLALDGHGKELQAAEAIAASFRHRESFRLADTIADRVTIAVAVAFAIRLDLSECEPDATARRHRRAGWHRDER